MQLGFIGLGKMGFNLVLNLLDKGHNVVAYDIDQQLVEKISEGGAVGVSSIQELIENIPTPRIIWMMVPAGEATEDVFQSVLPLLAKNDILIDGGNSHYKDSIRRGKLSNERDCYFFDCGTSGGIEGARNGACMMIGGESTAFSQVEQLFKDIVVEDGYLYAGPTGSGHFLKMIHNGIEYGMMQAIAEGFELLEKSPFNYDYEKVAKVWNNGSVIRSWLIELTGNAFAKDPNLEGIRGIMHSSGEGKWTVETALDYQAAAPVIALSLMMRYRSLEEDTFSGKIIAALRNEFGGHNVVKS